MIKITRPLFKRVQFQCIRYSSTTTSDIAAVSTAPPTTENTMSLISQLQMEGYCRVWTPSGLINNLELGLHYTGIPWIGTISIAGALCPILLESIFKLYSTRAKTIQTRLENQDFIMEVARIQRETRTKDGKGKRQSMMPSDNAKQTKLISFKKSGLEGTSAKLAAFSLAEGFLFFAGVMSTGMFSSPVLSNVAVGDGVGALAYSCPLMLWMVPMIYYSSTISSASLYAFEMHTYARHSRRFLAYIGPMFAMYIFAPMNMATGVFLSSFALSHFVVNRVASARVSSTLPPVKYFGGFIYRSTRLQTMKMAWKHS